MFLTNFFKNSEKRPLLWGLSSKLVRVTQFATFNVLVFSAVFLASSHGVAHAQAASNSPASATGAGVQAGDEMSAAIREYLRISGSEIQHALIINLMTEGAVVAARNALSESLKTKQISAANPSLAQPIINKRLTDFSVEARKYFVGKYPWSKIVDDIYMPMFRRTFTLAELKAANDYYKSAVGRKFAEQSPILFRDGVRLLGETYRISTQADVSPLVIDMIEKTRAELNKLEK
jgi:Uncharacterized protein conserved in bacteria (DUF2059)